jgi:hypothetical protein
VRRFWAEVNAQRKANPGWRYGQALFNIARDLWPEQANELRAGPSDPFYRDELAAVFLEDLGLLVGERF